MRRLNPDIVVMASQISVKYFSVFYHLSKFKGMETQRNNKNLRVCNLSFHQNGIFCGAPVSILFFLVDNLNYTSVQLLLLPVVSVGSG